MRNKIYSIFYYLLGAVFLTAFAVFLSVVLDKILLGETDFFLNGNFNIENIISAFFNTEKAKQLFWIIEGLIALFVFYFITQQNAFKSNVSNKKEVARGIKTPVAVGEGQYGTARFMEKKEINNVYSTITISKKDENIQNLLRQEKANTMFENAGIVVGFKKRFGKEYINYIGDDIHSLTVGSTRSRKDKTDLFYRQQV